MVALNFIISWCYSPVIGIQRRHHLKTLGAKTLFPSSSDHEIFKIKTATLAAFLPDWARNSQ